MVAGTCGKSSSTGESGMNEVGKSNLRLYRTSDIYFAAYLCSIDFPLEATENEKNVEGQKKVVFVFKMTEEHLKRAKTGFFGGSATVKARKFVDNIRSLKSMCFI